MPSEIPVEDLGGQSLSAGDVVQQTIPAAWRLLRGNKDTTVLQRFSSS
jgi:hypothetical protein